MDQVFWKLSTKKRWRQNLATVRLHVARQVAVPIRYKGKLLATPLRLDMVVADKVVVECKSVIEYNTIFEAQALTYLRLTGLKLAMVINFGEPLVSKGIHRVVNKLEI